MKRGTVLVIGILTSLVFVFLFLGKVIVNIDKPLGEDDLASHYFLVENNLTRLSNFEFDRLFDSRMLYPRENTLAFGNSFLGQTLVGLPIHLVTRDPITTVNVVLLTNFFLAFLFMYWLAFRLTGNLGGAIIAGLIYTYNPFVMAHFPHQLETLTIMWIPLIFVISERLIDKVNWSTSLLLALLFIMQLISSFYYVFFIALLWPVYMGLRIYMRRVKLRQFAHGGIVAGVVLVVMLSAVYLQPYLEVQRTYGYSVSQLDTKNLSARVTDFLFTASKNKLYGGMVQNVWWRSLRFPHAIDHYVEHSLFPGVVVYGLLLTALGLLVMKRLEPDKRQVAVVFLVLLGLAVILSFGPCIRNLASTSCMPSLYLVVYKVVPFANTLRAVTRFMVIGFLSLAVLAAIAWEYLWKRLRKGKLRLLLLLLVVALISLEYGHVWGGPVEIQPEIRDFYSWLDERKDTRVVLELPIANSLEGHPELERPEWADNRYLIYGLYHGKKIVNGYNGFIPQEVIDLGNALTINFPTRGKVEDLERMGVDMIIIHREEYKDSARADEVIQKLGRLQLDEVYTSEKIHAFALN